VTQDQRVDALLMTRRDDPGADDLALLAAAIFGGEAVYVEHTHDLHDHNAALCPRCKQRLAVEQEWVGDYKLACSGAGCAYRVIWRDRTASGGGHEWERPAGADADWTPPVRRL